MLYNLGGYAMRRVLYFIVCLVTTFEMTAASLKIEGHLSQEKLTELSAAVETLSKEKPKALTLLIDSQSAELLPTLNFAKALVRLRDQNKTKFIVYINENAIGPAAIFPFLANELYASPQAIWGAISNKEDKNVSTNVLRSRIEGFILPSQPRFAEFRLLSQAMCDSSVEVVEEKNTLIRGEGVSGQSLSKKGETLVLNQTELQKFGLISETLPLSEFTQKFSVAEISTFQPKTLIPDDFDKKLSRYIHFQEKQENQIGRLIIDDRQNGITQSTWIYVNAALNHYKKTKPACIILELNTPGGEVFAAQRISDALKDIDTQYGIPVIAYVNNWAISAGAMLAYSCRFIVIAKDASMGAAEPVFMGEGGQMQAASEKVNSALRTDFANRAKFFDRNSAIAEAMVDKDIILVDRHGKIMKLDVEEDIRKEGIDPDVIISPKGKLLTLNAEQMIKYGVADVTLTPLKLEPLNETEEATEIWPMKKSQFSQIPVFQKWPDCKIKTYQMNWQTKFFSILALPAISSLLFLGLVIGFYIEMSTPGFGMGAIVGIICLFFIGLSSFALQAIHWLEPILCLFGLAFILLEIFIFPTLGILGVIGTLFMLAGLGGMMVPGISSVEFDRHTLNAAGESVLSRLGWLSASFLVAMVIIGILSRYLTPRLLLMQRFVLRDTNLLATGKHEMDNPASLLEVKGGEMATVSMTLRPAGKIMIDDVELDAVSTGSFIEKGKRVKIMKVEGDKIIVDEVYSS
ncbi:MAG: hypothetical protein JWO53_4 [Chlamydiia bacterium]|nr:hypothetical protein [Chlamydiia bacterium]